jgi:hypothetical protein
MSSWIDYPPPPPPGLGRTPPLLVEFNQLDEFAAYFEDAGANRVDVAVANAVDSFSVIEALKTVLPFPEWCGSSWDSIEDAFEELRAAWSFPSLMVLRGFDRLLASHAHLALETTIRLHDLEQAFSVAGEQLILAFEGISWSS